MNLNQVENLYKTLSTLTQISMPIRSAYKITKLLNFMEKDYQFYIEETKKIVFKYAEKDEQGQILPSEDGSVKIQKESIPAAEKALLDLSEIEVETPSITFTLDELESLSIAPADLQNLLPFIEE